MEQVNSELLDIKETKSQANEIQMSKERCNSELKYQKRSGTTGIKGQLYETKLITLIRIRSFIQNYDEFYLGTSMEGIGALDDICVRYKRNNENVIVFLQAKHRTEATKGKIIADDLWKPTGYFSLLKYFDSYLKVRERFNDETNRDLMFKGKYEDLKCYLIIYTSAGNELNNKKNSGNYLSRNNVRDLIETGEYSDIFQYRYTDDEVDLLAKSMLIEEMKYLGIRLFKFIDKKTFMMMLNDCYIRKYHVVLARIVINVSDVNSAGHRTGTFREEFFESNDELLVTLKEVLFNEAVRVTKLNRDDVRELVQEVVLEPTTVAISNLMQTIPICYINQTNTLAITKIADKDLADTLSQVKIKYTVYKEARDIAVKEKLNSVRFKLPATFGNIDIVVSNGQKGRERIKYLATKIVKIMSYFKDKNIIVNNTLIGPDKPIDNGVIDLNGGIGSAVGNLLILSEDDASFKFNVNGETLGLNAKALLLLLKKKIKDLETYRFQMDMESFPKLSLTINTRDRALAKEFFSSLWFYTNQAKEHEVEILGKEILENYCITTEYASKRTATSVRYEAIYFKIHDEVQKWWMSDEESYYLTNNIQYFNDILKEFLDNSLLIVLNSVYMKQKKMYDIQFDKIAIQSLCKQFGPECTVVVTDAIILTGIKLVQHFQTLTDYAFIDLDSPLLLSRNDRHTLKQEIKNKNIKTLIIYYEDISESKNELFRYLIKEAASKQLIILTSTHSYEKLHMFFIAERKFMKVFDKNIQFSDLQSMSQKKVLSCKFIFQETEITLDTIIQGDAKYLITPCIMQKIVTKEKIEVGRAISNRTYEETKYYYIERHLCIKKESHKDLFSQSETEQLRTFNKLFPPEPNIRKKLVKLNTFEDVTGTVVLIGAPGTGKSSFLTHMSIKTKQNNPRLWIERINLLNYTKEFYRWQENKININCIEALKFMCKAAVFQKRLRNNFHYNFDEIIFDLEIVNEELVLKNYDAINCSVSFALELFIYCYNKGNTVFLFDGFDEICPHYKDEITELLKCLCVKTSKTKSIDRSSNKQRMWIASRSYKNIIETLQTEFGTPYDLEALTEQELKLSMKKFFKNNLNLNELNCDQFINIDGFFEYMKRNGDFYPKKESVKLFKYSNLLLDMLYYTAVEYFQSEIEFIQLSPEKHNLTEKWKTVKIFKCHISDLLRVNAHNIMWLHCMNKSIREEAMALAITPLHMYFALDYFIHEIKTIVSGNTEIISKWDLEANTLSFYSYFLERKLRKIRYEEKNQMDLYNPDVKLAYDKESKEFLDKHKKVAFYATYIEELDEILTSVEIDEIRQIIKEFEAAEEKTGVVDYVLNGVPKFIHLTFQEYLTAEYVLDLLKTMPQKDRPKLWEFICKNVRKGVLEFFDRKLESDNDLICNITLSLNDTEKEIIFNTIVFRNRLKKASEMLNIVDDATLMDLRCISKFLLKIIVDVTNEDNLQDFLHFLYYSSLFNNIARKHWDDILVFILDCIRRIDPRKLPYFHYGIEKQDSASFSNEEILRNLKTELNCFSRLVVPKRYLCELNAETHRRRRTF